MSALHKTKYGQIFNKNIKIGHPRESGDPVKGLIKMDIRFRGNDGVLGIYTKIHFLLFRAKVSNK